MRVKQLCMLMFLLLVTEAAQSQAPEVHESSTGWCTDRAGNTVRCSSAPPPTGPTGPSPEEVKRQREAKDLSEAALDANDKGAEAYEKGEWETAVKYFKEAREYAPDDPDIRTNLQRAEKRARESAAAKQLTSVERHSDAAGKLPPDSSRTEAGRGIDTAGKPAGPIPAPAVYAGSRSYKDPVVPPGKRTPAIATLEGQREGHRKELSALQEKLKTLDPRKDAVEVSKIKQHQSTLKGRITYLNLSITEQLKTPVQIQPSESPR